MMKIDLWSILTAPELRLRYSSIAKQNATPIIEPVSLEDKLVTSQPTEVDHVGEMIIVHVKALD